jgi:hypothetical protein
VYRVKGRLSIRFSGIGSCIDGYSSIWGGFYRAGDGNFLFMVEELFDVKNIAFWVGEREDFILHFS